MTGFGFTPTPPSLVLILFAAATIGAQNFSVQKLWGKTVDPAGSAGTVETCEFSFDGKKIAAGNSKNEVRIYETGSGQLLKTIKTFSGSSGDAKSGEVEAVYWSPDGKMLAATGNATGVRIFDANSGALIKQLSATATSDAATFSPNGKWFACQIGVYEVSTWSRISVMGHGCDVNSIDFSRDSKYMISGACDKKVIVRATAGWQVVKTITTGGSVKSVRLSPDEKLLAGGLSGNSYETHVWSFPGLNLVKKFPVVYRGTEKVTNEAVAWSADGFFLFSGYARRDGDAVYVFAAGSWKSMGTLPGEKACDYLDVHGDLVLTGGENGNITLFKYSGKNDGVTGLTAFKRQSTILEHSPAAQIRLQLAPSAGKAIALQSRAETGSVFLNLQGHLMHMMQIRQ